LDEVARFADEVTVMRRGSRVLHQRLGEDRADVAHALTAAIMGDEPPDPPTPPALADDASVVLELAGVCVVRDERRALDLDLAVRGGEVLGVAGVEGNGQTELVRVLAGLMPADGVMRLGGEVLAGGPARRRDQGLVVVHEDRHRDELVLGATVADNLVLGDLGCVRERRAVRERFARFAVQPPDPGRLAGELSGGNQQKVVMARALDRTIAALVLAQPTRGVDIGTARVIHEAIAETARAGAAVIIISADLIELRSLCHRIVVLRRGRIAAELTPDASDHDIGRAMLGGTAA
jgi:simple sugar transport system ATP-binding protein